MRKSQQIDWRDHINRYWDALSPEEREQGHLEAIAILQAIAADLGFQSWKEMGRQIDWRTFHIPENEVLPDGGCPVYFELKPAIRYAQLRQKLNRTHKVAEGLKKNLRQANNRIRLLERKLVGSALNIPTRPYLATEDRLPFVSPESPFPTDLDSSAQGDDEE